MDMYSYILQIFRLQANTVASWGFNQPVRVPDGNGMEFSVEGFIHQGKVKVLYNAGTDAFDIYILNADGSTKEANRWKTPPVFSLYRVSLAYGLASVCLMVSSRHA